jgi:membrane fusion protein (multidrug efflux system)
MVELPSESILHDTDGAYVYVLEDNVATKRPVHLQSSWQDTWLVSQGLEAGDQVITTQVLKLFPGAPVVVTPAQQPEGRP